MINAHNLNDPEWIITTFDECGRTDLEAAIHAVRYGHAHETSKLSLFFALSQDCDKNGLDECFPITKGSRSVACGDWCALI